MERKLIVVGDPPASGGRVLPYVGREHSMYGHQVALIGGRAYCEGCNSLGIIAKAGGPRRIQFITEIALEGDVVVCHCPAPQPLIATLVHTATCDDMGGGGTMIPAMLQPGGLTADTSNLAASKKLVDSEVEHPPEAEQTENICPNMTNKEFAIHVLDLRDRAVDFVTKRIEDLERWGRPEQQRAVRWFGQSDEELRRHLHAGLKACVRVLKGLTEGNFVRYSEQAMRNVGCLPSGNAPSVLAAEVCKPDLKTRTIGIGIQFCTLSELASRTDSQIATLIHEVTHFDDVFASNDTVGQMSQALKLTSNPQAARVNADSIVGYVLYAD